MMQYRLRRPPPQHPQLVWNAHLLRIMEEVLPKDSALNNRIHLSNFNSSSIRNFNNFNNHNSLATSTSRGLLSKQCIRL